ncbi:MAG: type II toxin-antitoxin system RelE/ParE family toxin [Acidobacteriota bacterium]
MPHRVSPRAVADLDEIWFFVAMESSSLEVADRLIDSITQHFLSLARQPYLGRSREREFGIAVQSFAVGARGFSASFTGGGIWSACSAILDRLYGFDGMAKLTASRWM